MLSLFASYSLKTMVKILVKMAVEIIESLVTWRRVYLKYGTRNEESGSRFSKDAITHWAHKAIFNDLYLKKKALYRHFFVLKLCEKNSSVNIRFLEDFCYDFPGPQTFRELRETDSRGLNPDS